MRLACAAIFAVLCALAADPQLSSLELRAQSDFDRVALAADPQLADTVACVQSEAAWMAVAPVAQQALVQYRKGYCTLIGAIIANDASAYAGAAAEFDKATLPVLASIARLKASPAPDGAALDNVEATLALAEDRPTCASTVMPAAECQGNLAIGHLWLGWIALRRGNLTRARQELSAAPPSAWSEWALGRQAFEAGAYYAAVGHYQAAIARWPGERRQLLWPRPDVGLTLTELGGAQTLAGHPADAIATLDRATKEDPHRARAFYLRARAKELLGQAEAAQADYNLASRTAFAGARDLASGEAHLYRGILLYRRKDLSRAEDEFSSALNFEIPKDLRADASAWRRLAAVASGSCGASRDALGGALAAASPFFPRAEAQAAMDSCIASAAK